MKAEVYDGDCIQLRAESADEQKVLDAFWDDGIKVHCGGALLGISRPWPLYQLNFVEEEVAALLVALGQCIGTAENQSMRETYRHLISRVFEVVQKHSSRGAIGFPTKSAKLSEGG